MTTSDMMFYVKTAVHEEDNIRRAGLDQLRKKLHKKMTRYNPPEAWPKTENNLYL